MCVQVLLSPSLSALLYLITSTRMAHQCGARSVRLPSLARSILAKSGLLLPSCHPWLTLTSPWSGQQEGRASPSFPLVRGALGCHLLPTSSSQLISLAAVELSAFPSLGLEATSQPRGLGVWWGQPGLGPERQKPHQHYGGGPRSVTPGWRVE